MPLTPFHLCVIIFGLIFLNTFYIPALLISSVLMDFEPFYYLFISPRSDYVIHSFFHTYAGATILGLIVAFILVKTRKKCDNLMKKFKINQKNISNKKVYLSSLFAAYLHIFLDSFMHSDIKPFFPFTNNNPLLGVISVEVIYILTTTLLIITIIIYLAKFIIKRP